MTGLTHLATLLSELAPELAPGSYVFCSIERFDTAQMDALHPFAAIREDQGTTLVLEKAAALRAGLRCTDEFRRLTLRVHSSLHAVGLTAAVATALTERGISANMIAGYYHDHVFVPAERAAEALEVMRKLACQ